MRFYTIFIILFLGLVYAESSDAIPNCPTIFDGLTNGAFDLSTQFSKNTISSNWVGLSSSDVISYEWAIISQKKAAKLSPGCRLSQGFNGIPDIQDWTSVKKQTSVTTNRLSLEPESTYYVVLRTTLQNGAHVYSNSNGILVLPSEIEEQFLPKERTKTSTSRNTLSRETRALQNVPITNFIFGDGSCYQYPAVETCEIDNENRCRQSTVTVHDYLNTIYGKPVFPIITPLPPVIVYEETRSYRDDDDDATNINSGIVVATVVGGTLFFLLPLLLLCCIACILNRNEDDDKFTERIQEKDIEQVDAEGGTFKQHSIGPENTKVEFPDIDPHNRLSVA